jgi:hypothetical protein
MTFKDAVELSLVLSTRKGYPATIFRLMWKADPSMHMLEGMVKQGSIQTGLTRLANLGLLKHSVEQIVIDYSTNREAVTAAQWRLKLVQAQRKNKSNRPT